MSDRVERVPDGLAAVADMALVLSLIATNEGRTPNEVLRSAIAAYQGPPPERAILADLITELRETAAVKPGATGRLLMEMVGSAEARLREVGDE